MIGGRARAGRFPRSPASRVRARAVSGRWSRREWTLDRGRDGMSSRHAVTTDVMVEIISHLMYGDVHFFYRSARARGYL